MAPLHNSKTTTTTKTRAKLTTGNETATTAPCLFAITVLGSLGQVTLPLKRNSVPRLEAPPTRQATGGQIEFVCTHGRAPPRLSGQGGTSNLFGQFGATQNTCSGVSLPLPASRSCFRQSAQSARTKCVTHDDGDDDSGGDTHNLCEY